MSSSGNLQERVTLPIDKETFTENVPSDAKGGCELEEKHEQSMLSESQLKNLCRDDIDPCGFCREVSENMRFVHRDVAAESVIEITAHAQSSSPVPAPTPSDLMEMHRMRTGLRQAVTLV